MVIDAIGRIFKHKKTPREDTGEKNTPLVLNSTPTAKQARILLGRSEDPGTPLFTYVPGTTTIDPDSINRTAMSRAIGVDTAHISRILAAKVRPGLRTATLMADYLHITMEELVIFLNSITPQR